MGLSHSKPHPRVTKVAPLQNKEEELPSASPVDFAFSQNLEEKSSYLFTGLQDQNKALEGQLPPLRETWYGRYSAGPRAMYFDIPMEHGETSIIKRHPPRRLQISCQDVSVAKPSGKPEGRRNWLLTGREQGREMWQVDLENQVGAIWHNAIYYIVDIPFIPSVKLEPIDLPQVITSERLLSQQEARTTHRAKQELEKTMPTPGYIPGKRQYLHKMRMLEMNRNRQEAQAELKKSLHREARINKQKPRDHKTKKILQSIPRNDDRDLPTFLPDETLNRSPGNSQNEDLGKHQARNDCRPRKIGKMEMWLREQEARGQLLWDSSSSDSDELRKSEKKPQALVRTRTERIPLFDEFFDRE